MRAFEESREENRLRHSTPLQVVEIVPKRENKVGRETTAGG